MLVLAPMAGISDIGFRKLCVSYGAEQTCTEMISVNGLCYGSEGTLKMLNRHESEKRIAVQLFGNEPELFRIAVQNPAIEYFDIIDINMGCPVKKVVKRGAGCALMQDVKTAEKIISACVLNTKKPVTVKFRLGKNELNLNAVEFGIMAEANGASAVAVHGRTHEQFYSGKANWYEIAKVRNALKIPVFANGDIKDIESLKECERITGCQDFMIGRGAYGRPWVFAELKAQKPFVNKFQVIKEHISEMLKYYDSRFVVPYMRHHLSWYLKGETDARALRQRVNEINEIDELMGCLAEMFTSSDE